MKKIITLALSLLLVSAMSVSAFAADLAEDRTTHGDWVGKYGKDGYIIFNSSESTFTENLPDYVQEITYSDLYEANATPHSWWSGADGSELEDPAHFNDALWEDESMTSRRAPCIYNGEGVMITVDTGDVTTTVSFYSLDWDDNGRVILVTMYDADGNEVTSKEVGEFYNGVYVSTEVTGKATFEFMFLESVKTSPSNAVVSAVFFDSAASEAEAETAEEAETEPETEAETEPEIVVEPAEEVPAETEPETIEAPAAPAENEETQTTAPQTFDVFSVLAS
ncbi:MAG: hypothetical protein ACI4XJ_00595, partial [Eubacteriales bacterium]